MEFETIDFNNKARWSEITKDREVYYQWQYLDAFQKRGDGTPILAYASDGVEAVVNVFFLRNINEDLKIDLEKQYFDIATPYGYGGVDYKGDNKQLLHFFFEKFEEYCKEKNIVSEFIRLCPFTNNYKNYEGSHDYIINRVSKTVSIKLEDSEQIWSDMEGRCRRAIRKAQRNNLVVKSGFTELQMAEFKNIYYDTMSRDNADDYYFFDDKFFDSILKNLTDFANIYTVYLGKKPISSTIAIFNGDSAHYHLSGTLSDYMTYGANNMIIYEIAKDLCEKGYKSFHLGGGYGGDTSPLLMFKKSFNKHGELDFYIGKKIYDQDRYDELCKIVNVSKEEAFFPAYRKGEC